MAFIAVLPALALVAGAVCGSMLDVLPASAPSILALAVASAVAACLADRHAAFVACMAAAFWWGAVALASDARAKAIDTPLRDVLHAEYGGFAIDTIGPVGRHDPIRVRGVLTEDASRDVDAATLRMAVTSVQVDGIEKPVSGGVVFAVSGREALVLDWTAGRTLDLMATFRRPARYLNEGVRDFENDLALAGTTLFGSVKSGLLVDVVARGNPVAEAAARVRRHVRTATGRWIASHDPLSAAIVAAVLIGDRTGLPDQIRDRLQAAGTYHVIAISGGNIAILAGLSFGLLFLCGFAGRGAALITLLVLAAYAEVVTSSTSVWRATLMASLYLFARVLDHRSEPWQAMGVAAAMVVCASPLDVHDTGFILTFGATAALLEVARRLITAPGARPAPGRWIAASLAASAAAEIVLLPVSATSFSRVTGAGLVLNLVAVPLMSVVQIAGMAVVIADGIGPLASAAGWIAHAAARGIVSSSQLVDVWPWLAHRVATPPFGVVVVYYASLVVALCFRRFARVAGLLVLVTAAAAIVVGVRPAHAAPAELRLTVFDVGQGDATLLELPDGHRLQIDSGGVPFGSTSFNIGAHVLAPALWARGVRRLDGLLLTHGDPDHIGGARSLLDDFRPAHVWDGIRVPGHVPMRDLLAQAAAAGATVEGKRAGQQMTWGNARIRVLHPPLPDWERRRVRNDDSIVLEVLYGAVAILLTGDIGSDVERTILPQLTPSRIRILKVAHHGSRTSSSSGLLEAWRPQIALISCGRGNSFGHPAPDVIARLQSAGAAIYRTDLDGQITLSTDGDDVSVNTFVEHSS